MKKYNGKIGSFSEETSEMFAIFILGQYISIINKRKQVRNNISSENILIKLFKYILEFK